MNTRGRNSLQSMKNSLQKEKVRGETQRNRMMNAADKANTIRRGANRERKMALQQDVDMLKKRLRHEENVHRALERAFTRPLGALPRLPSYLPPDTLELLAEVAVLEEEVVRLEEKVVHFRQGLYQEAVYISSSKKNMDNSADLWIPAQIRHVNPQQPKSSCHTDENSPAMCLKKNLPSLSVERWGNENQCSTNLLMTKQQSPNRKGRTVRTPVKRPPGECKSADTHSDSLNSELENHVKVSCRSSEEKDTSSQEEMPTANDSPNKVSENILKCLMNIFLRMSSQKSTSTAESLSSPSPLKTSDLFASTEFKDPYGICSNFGKRDIGPYKLLFGIEASSINLTQKTKSVFLIQRLKLLLQKLAAIELKSLVHHEKIAFWINIYNSCMMKAYLEYGIPESPDMVIALMQKATVNVGGHILNAITIEHFILRLPYHSKYTFSNGLKSDGMTARGLFGLELSEPLVTFALSCGSWSSPAVRVYTASQVDNELETAKRDFLQAAIGMSKEQNVFAIPKLLEWYLLDFAKNMDSLLDWICLQLPCELGKEAMQCLERCKDEPLLQSLEILPYEFNFRYLMLT